MAQCHLPPSHRSTTSTFLASQALSRLNRSTSNQQVIDQVGSGSLAIGGVMTDFTRDYGIKLAGTTRTGNGKLAS